MIKTSTLPYNKQQSPKKKKTTAQTAKLQLCPSDAVISTLLNYSKSLKVVHFNSIGIVDNLLNWFLPMVKILYFYVKSFKLNMKKFFVLFVVTIALLSSCRGHGPLCPAYSTIKKEVKQSTASASTTKKVKLS